VYLFSRSSFIIFDLENARERYPGTSNEELEALSKEDLYKNKILAFCPMKCHGAGNLMSLVKGRDLSLTGTHVIRNQKGLFLVDKWDPTKEVTKQLHEINIENKMECMKRIANIANLGKDMSELTHRENISTTLISNTDLSWEANFAKLVEYVGDNFRLPSQVDGPTTVNGKTKLGKWYNCERKRSSNLPLPGEFAYRV
jgi:hypothetical protein